MFTTDLEKILDFVQKHLKYEDREKIKGYLIEHEKFNTFDYAIDTNGDIVAIVRFNMDGDIAQILDFAIKYEFRGRGIGKDFINRALMKFPDIKWLKFKRGVRFDERERILDINGILKREIL